MNKFRLIIELIKFIASLDVNSLQGETACEYLVAVGVEVQLPNIEGVQLWYFFVEGEATLGMNVEYSEGAVQGRSCNPVPQVIEFDVHCT